MLLGSLSHIAVSLLGRYGTTYTGELARFTLPCTIPIEACQSLIDDPLHSTLSNSVYFSRHQSSLIHYPLILRVVERIFNVVLSVSSLAVCLAFTGLT